MSRFPFSEVWDGSNNELTQKYETVKVQNDLRTSKHIYKQTNIPNLNLCYRCKCLAHYTRSPINHTFYAIVIE